MRPQIVLGGLVASATAATNDTTPEIPNVVPSQWDGHCYYPTSDSAFELESYLGRWYQVAGTLAPFTAGCKCIFAQYALNVSTTALKKDLYALQSISAHKQPGQRHRPGQQHLRGRGPAGQHPRHCLPCRSGIRRQWSLPGPVPNATSACLPRAELHCPRLHGRYCHCAEQQLQHSVCPEPGAAPGRGCS